MAKLSEYKQSTAALEGGRWFPWMADIELLIRPLDNEDYQARLRELQKPNERLMRAAPDSDMARKATREAVRKAAAECVLVGWRNVEDENGPVEYSPAKALELFQSAEFAHLYRFVVTTAGDERSFLAADEEDDQGN